MGVSGSGPNYWPPGALRCQRIVCTRSPPFAYIACTHPPTRQWWPWRLCLHDTPLWLCRWALGIPYRCAVRFPFPAALCLFAPSPPCLFFLFPYTPSRFPPHPTPPRPAPHRITFPLPLPASPRITSHPSAPRLALQSRHHPLPGPLPTFIPHQPRRHTGHLPAGWALPPPPSCVVARGGGAGGGGGAHTCPHPLGGGSVSPGARGCGPVGERGADVAPTATTSPWLWTATRSRRRRRQQL